MEDLFKNYASDEDEIISLTPSAISNTLTVCSAPFVVPDAVGKFSGGNNTHALSLSSGKNFSAEIMLAPQVGPVNPFIGSSSSYGGTRSGLGYIEETHVEDYAFDSSYQEYIRGDRSQHIKPKVAGQAVRGKRSRVEMLMETLDDDNEGPWTVQPDAPEVLPYAVMVAQAEAAKFAAADEAAKVKLDAEEAVERVKLASNIHIVEPDEEAEKWEKVNERKQSLTLPPRPSRGSIPAEAKSTFHGVAERDYQGRAWSVAPSTAVEGDSEHTCYIPKKCIHKFLGHTKGVQAIELFPKTGHLLLSASMDGKCKVWDVLREKNVLRTYAGHDEAVRSIHINSDGGRFLSSGYDRYIRLWDLETGKAAATFSNRKMHYQVRFCPDDDNSFICASSDNRLYQWDVRAGTISQEYNYHLQSCNTVTFFDKGRKFLSTSDDKKILVWETGIPVPIKYITEPEMHSVPSISLHPSESFFVGQSMDNTIVTYSCGDKVRQLKKKIFKGHNNSGYACQVGFSPNGKFLVSGDGFGKLHFWDWKTCKPYRKLQAHDSGPCMVAAWHPALPSAVFTCGWDGQIKMWE